MQRQYSESDAARFWANVDIRGDDECWPWKRSCFVKGGYGEFGYGSRTDGTRRLLYANRVAWELLNGPIPDGLFALHTCDNPPCCNPAHLWLGTRGDNNRDRDAKGRRGKWGSLKYPHRFAR